MMADVDLLCYDGQATTIMETLLQTRPLISRLMYADLIQTSNRLNCIIRSPVRVMHCRFALISCLQIDSIIGSHYSLS